MSGLFRRTLERSPVVEGLWLQWFLALELMQAVIHFLCCRVVLRCWSGRVLVALDSEVYRVVLGAG